MSFHVDSVKLFLSDKGVEGPTAHAIMRRADRAASKYSKDGWFSGGSLQDVMGDSRLAAEFVRAYETHNERYSKSGIDVRAGR